MRYQIYSYTCA